ncbi:MAG: hypothetical protein WC675_03200 [Patescibacteria group bacterium]|jgi:hypothetical protein
MILTVHAAAGVLIGSFINQSPIAFLVGFVSHSFLDMLPHDDSDIHSKGHTVKSLKKLYFNKIIGLIYLDVCLAIIVAAALFTNNAHFITRPIIWGIIGSILPDVLQALSFLQPKNRVLKKFNGFHSLIHYSPKNPISLVMGHTIQIVTLIILINPLI